MIVTVLGVLVAVGLIGFLVAQRVAHVDTTSLASFTPPPASSPTPAPTPLPDLARSDMSRVVTVQAERTNAEELGTGWLFDAHGDFVTNAHVIDGQITVRIRDRQDRTHPVTVLGVDAALDIALLRSNDGFAGDPLRVDQTRVTHVPLDVITIASGKATGQPELTQETLSQVDQNVPLASSDIQKGAGQPSVYHHMMELDGAKIYQGNSGGPVIDSAGAVIGIVTLASKSQAQGFAIPMSQVYAELLSYSMK